jgi:branched-chain amino acid aminotransferase
VPAAWPPAARVVTVPWPRNDRAALAGAKTTSYAENVVALSRAHAAGAGEALFLDTQGRICECTGSNIFLVLDGELVTPSLVTGCLAGVTRALVLEWCGGREAELDGGALASASEVFLTSTTRDVQPVAAVDDLTYPAPGPVTARAMEVFAQRAAADVDP